MRWMQWVHAYYSIITWWRLFWSYSFFLVVFGIPHAFGPIAASWNKSNNGLICSWPCFTASHHIILVLILAATDSRPQKSQMAQPNSNCVVALFKNPSVKLWVQSAAHHMEAANYPSAQSELVWAHSSQLALSTWLFGANITLSLLLEKLPPYGRLFLAPAEGCSLQLHQWGPSGPTIGPFRPRQKYWKSERA